MKWNNEASGKPKAWPTPKTIPELQPTHGKLSKAEATKAKEAKAFIESWANVNTLWLRWAEIFPQPCHCSQCLEPFKTFQKDLLEGCIVVMNSGSNARARYVAVLAKSKP